MDRFQQGLPDPQEQPVAWFADCANEDCMQEIFLGDQAIYGADGHFYCSEHCYVVGSDARYITAGMED